MKRATISNWNFSLVLLGAITVQLFTGCFQYPEGPVFTLQLRDERISGTWLLTGFTDDAGNNLLNEHQNETLVVEYSKSGDRKWAEYKDGNLVSEGTYLFAAHSDYIIITYVYLNGDVTTGVQLFYTVRRLTEKEFKYIDDKGNTLSFEKY
jgi:hypothetical protein